MFYPSWFGQWLRNRLPSHIPLWSNSNPNIKNMYCGTTSCDNVLNYTLHFKRASFQLFWKKADYSQTSRKYHLTKKSSVTFGRSQILHLYRKFLNESLPGKCVTILQEINSILYFSRPTGNTTAQRLPSYVSAMTFLEPSTKKKK